MSRPLNGISVIDLGQIYQGGYCGLLLSYLGADVVKVEPPWGENVRTRSEDGTPPQVQFLNANKRGITLDLTSEAGREALVDLAAEADVLLENFLTGKMENWELATTFSARQVRSSCTRTAPATATQVPTPTIRRWI